MPKVEIIETRDGSSSLFLPEMNETYHSTHGALTEAKYVFLDKGLEFIIDQNPSISTIRILEIGFGTGLNAWLTAIEAQKLGIKIEFTSLEKFPLDKATISQLNYQNGCSKEDSNLFHAVHACTWGNLQKINSKFDLQKIEVDIFDFEPSNETFDLVYFDAFAPSKQPELWKPEVLAKMYKCLAFGGVFVTYCAQGQFKRDLKAAHFETQELPGPPGKKEMTRGVKVLHHSEQTL